MNINDIRKDLEIMVDGQPHVVIDVEHVKPLKAPPFAHVRIKNIETGNVRHHTFKQHDKLELADVEHHQLQIVSRIGEVLVFNDITSNNELRVPVDKIDRGIVSVVETMYDDYADGIMFKGRLISVDISSYLNKMNQ